MPSQDKINAKDVSMMGLMLALAVLAGYVEMLIPLDIGFPGVKLGLANVVILYVFYMRGMPAAFLISILRTIIIALLFTSPAVLLYSLSGAAVSIAVMSCIRKNSSFSIYGVSAAGGTIHNITQFIVAMIISGSGSAWEQMICFYLPVLMIAGECAGVMNAFVTLLINRSVGIKYISSI